MGPLFLICCNQKRVQYYCFFWKKPNDFPLNHRLFPVNITPGCYKLSDLSQSVCEKYHKCVISASKQDLYLCYKNKHAGFASKFERVA